MPYVRLLRHKDGFRSNCYLIVSGDECAVVDPSVPFEGCNEKVRYILLTHAHFDHIFEIDSWVKGTGATVVISSYDKAALADEHRNCYFMFMRQSCGYYGETFTVSDGDVLPLGDETITVLACPGHTPGSVTYIAKGCAFVGDTVFAEGGYGRYDLPGGDPIMLSASIERLMLLDERLLLYPGHGPEFTLREFKSYYIPIIH